MWDTMTDWLDRSARKKKSMGSNLILLLWDVPIITESLTIAPQLRHFLSHVRQNATVNVNNWRRVGEIRRGEEAQSLILNLEQPWVWRPAGCNSELPSILSGSQRMRSQTHAPLTLPICLLIYSLARLVSPDRLKPREPKQVVQRYTHKDNRDYNCCYNLWYTMQILHAVGSVLSILRKQE